MLPNVLAFHVTQKIKIETGEESQNKVIKLFFFKYWGLLGSRGEGVITFLVHFMK